MSVQVRVEPRDHNRSSGRLCPNCGVKRQVNVTACRNCGKPVSEWHEAAAEPSVIAEPKMTPSNVDAHEAPAGSRSSTEQRVPTLGAPVSEDPELRPADMSPPSADRNVGQPSGPPSDETQSSNSESSLQYGPPGAQPPPPQWIPPADQYPRSNVGHKPGPDNATTQPPMPQAPVHTPASSVAQYCPGCGNPRIASGQFCPTCGQSYHVGSAEPAVAIEATGTVRVSPKVLAISSIVVVLAVLLTISVVKFAGSVAGRPTHTIHGTMTLIDSGFGTTTSCTGSDASSGYSDISAGAGVTVEDAGGKVIGASSLDPGTLQNTVECVFPFTVTKVADSAFYKVTVSHRGTLSYSADQMKSNGWKVEVSLGA
jgi:uncharacterized OB-fold protein